jgi:hypothetical protein
LFVVTGNNISDNGPNMPVLVPDQSIIFLMGDYEPGNFLCFCFSIPIWIPWTYLPKSSAKHRRRTVRRVDSPALNFGAALIQGAGFHVSESDRKSAV